MNPITKTLNSKGSKGSKEENLRQTVQGCKLVKLRLNLAEISSLAGIHENTAANHRKKIDEFWNEPSLTPDEDKKFIREKAIDLGIKEILTGKEPNLEAVFGVILGTFLKVETSLLDEAESLAKVWTIGKHITRVYRLVCNYKNPKGVPVHSEYQSAKYLINLKGKDNLNNLFIRSRHYVPGRRAKRWLASRKV